MHGRSASRLAARDAQLVVVARGSCQVARQRGYPPKARPIPGLSLADGYRFADQIHNTGQAIVWSGTREDAEQYWSRLDAAGLTMAPLESG